jgi:hypothetical protein
VKDFISEFGFYISPFSENIGHQALIYVEEYTLSSNMSAGVAIIAATAIENNMILVTGNVRPYRTVTELRLKAFKP